MEKIKCLLKEGLCIDDIDILYIVSTIIVKGILFDVKLCQIKYSDIYFLLIKDSRRSQGVAYFQNIGRVFIFTYRRKHYLQKVKEWNLGLGQYAQVDQYNVILNDALSIYIDKIYYYINSSNIIEKSKEAYINQGTLIINK